MCRRFVCPTARLLCFIFLLAPLAAVAQGAPEAGSRSAAHAGLPRSGKPVQPGPGDRAEGDAVGPPAPPEPLPLGLTVSGGVSLGAYEAGFLYYHLRMLQQLPRAVQLKGATGASAGSLNALLALLQMCRQEDLPPHESLFWRAWIPVGLNTLYSQRSVRPLGLFRRRWMHQVAAAVRAEWDKGLPESCDVAWGVAVTRLHPRNVSLAHDRLDVPRIEEKFTLHIQGQGLGRPPAARNFFDPRSGIEQALLLEDENGFVSFDDIRDATFASCSFPLAFTPMALRYCITQPTSPARDGNAPACSQSDASVSAFIDGGVLDNSPLRLLARTMQAGLERDPAGGYRWRQGGKGEQTPASPTAYYMFVSPEASDYPRYEAAGTEPTPGSALTLVKQVVSTFINTARTKELYTLLEERPDLRDRIFLTRRHVPAAGGLMSAFFGFFERDLRIYDFTLGMYDARRAFEEEARPHLIERFGEGAFTTSFPEERDMGTPETASQWQPLLCMRSVFDHQQALAGACQGEEMENFRILLQTSLTRLYDHCARLDWHRLPPTTNDFCRLAGQGEEVPHLADVLWPRTLQSRRGSEESELEYLLRLLSAHQFRFTDLGLTRERSDEALGIIRARLEGASSALAAKQPLSERQLVQLSAETLVDWAAYTPPRAMVYGLLARSLEVGGNIGLTYTSRRTLALRLDLPLWFDNVFTWITSSRSRIAFGPGIGLELMMSRPKSRYLQWRSGVRVGYMLSAGDHFGRGQCTPEQGRQSSGCTRPRLEYTLGLTALEHLRLQLAATWYLPAQAHGASVWAVTPGIGLQF